MAVPPLRREVERRRNGQYAGRRRPQQMRHSGTSDSEGSPHIDGDHQIESLDLGLRRPRELDRAGVVHNRVNAAEGICAATNRGRRGVRVPDIADQGKRPSARPFHRLRRGMNGAGKARVRLVRLGRKGDIGPVPRRSAVQFPCRFRAILQIRRSCDLPTIPR